MNDDQADGKKTQHGALPPAERDNVRRRLEQLKEELGSQVAVERATRISQQLISKILLGGDASLYVARLLAEYDRVPIDVEFHGWIRHLEMMIRDNPGRWRRETLVCLRGRAEDLGYSDATDVSPDAWEKLADEIESKMVVPVVVPVLEALASAIPERTDGK